MSLTLHSSKNTVAIALLMNKKPKKIYLENDENDDENDETKEIIFSKSENLLPYFDPNKSYRIFISGSTGSGKTVLCEKILATSFKHVEHIYLFSSIADADYSKFGEKIVHIDIEDFEDNFPDIDIYEFIEDNSVVIFDDILSYRKNKPYIDLRSRFISTGRHRGISTICIEQQCMNMTKTRDVLLNCEIYIFFPNSSYRSYVKCATEYLGLPKNKIEMLGSKKSRWIAFNKVFPMYAVLEHSIYIC